MSRWESPTRLRDRLTTLRIMSGTRASADPNATTRNTKSPLPVAAPVSAERHPRIVPTASHNRQRLHKLYQRSEKRGYDGRRNMCPTHRLILFGAALSTAGGRRQ